MSRRTQGQKVTKWQVSGASFLAAALAEPPYRGGGLIGGIGRELEAEIRGQRTEDRSQEDRRATTDDTDNTDQNRSRRTMPPSALVSLYPCYPCNPWF